MSLSFPFCQMRLDSVTPGDFTDLSHCWRVGTSGAAPAEALQADVCRGDSLAIEMIQMQGLGNVRANGVMLGPGSWSRAAVLPTTDQGSPVPHFPSPGPISGVSSPKNRSESLWAVAAPTSEISPYERTSFSHPPHHSVRQVLTLKSTGAPAMEWQV